MPTPEGWRVFVDRLPRGPARPEHQRLLDVGLADADPRRSLRSAARVLSELCGCAAIGFVGEARPGVVHAVELVPLAGGSSAGHGRLLVMLKLEDGASSVHTVELDRALLDDAGQLRRRQLVRLAGLLRDLTVGRSLVEAQDELRELLAAQQERLDHCMAEALRIGMLLCAASFDPLWMQVAGWGSLVSEVEGAGAGARAGELLAALEDYQRLAEILCQLLPEPGDRPRAAVHLDVGIERFAGALPFDADEAVVRSASGLTLVGCRLRLPHGSQSPPTGAVAVLGSPRMDYEAVIPLIEYAARAMTSRG
nr:hypothetical protein [Pseudenhygromyxa sp. WMMC2535]